MNGPNLSGDRSRTGNSGPTQTESRTESSSRIMDMIMGCAGGVGALLFGKSTSYDQAAFDELPNSLKE
jgi:hypothetical protein